MVIKMTKYCVVTEDLKQVEVGQSRNYHFIPIEELEKSKSKIQLFNSYKVAKSSFLRSWSGIKWDEDKQMFVPADGWRTTDNYVIKRLTITYDVDLDKEEVKK